MEWGPAGLSSRYAPGDRFGSGHSTRPLMAGPTLFPPERGTVFQVLRRLGREMLQLGAEDTGVGWRMRPIGWR